MDEIRARIMCGVLSGLDTLGDLALYANEKKDDKLHKFCSQSYTSHQIEQTLFKLMEQ